MSELITPFVQIRNQSLVIYNRFNGKRKKSIFQKTGNNLKNIKKYQGKMTIGTQKRMTRAINLMVAASQKKVVFNPILNRNVNFQLSFITLTIPDNTFISLRDAHKFLLEPFIKWLRQNHDMKLYVWKAECQKRGQLHYHLTADCFVHYQELRNKWNQLLNRMSLMEDYKSVFGNCNPNSTDIHNVKKVRDLAAYLIKYFTKQEQNEHGLIGKIWDCSISLKKSNYYATELTGDIEYDIFNSASRKECKIVYDDRFSFVKFKSVQPISIFPKEVKAAYYQNLLDIRNYKREVSQMDMYSKKTDNCTEKQALIKTMPKTVDCVQMDLFQSVAKNKVMISQNADNGSVSVKNAT